MPELRKNPKQRDIVGDAAQENALQAPEEISNQARGHKANLSNPSKSKLTVHVKTLVLTKAQDTSEQSKENSKQKLEELGGEGAFFSKDSK